LEQGVDVFGFFNNHYAGHSPESVRQFAEMLGVELKEVHEGEASAEQLRLEAGNGEG
jgi:uncharacterized protein YecE (DUF72 family)